MSLKDRGGNPEFSIQKTLQKQEEDRQRRLKTHRLELARAGLAAFQAKRIGEATKSFHSYIRCLEEIHNVKVGGLLPSHFDQKVDSSELLMISGVYWDLVKLYDRTQSPEKYQEFCHYLEKYILFSKGMPFQGFCAESVRKYLTHEKPVHKSDFKYAYKLISGDRCFVATSLIDVISPETLPSLRAFRDTRLKNSPAGRSFIVFYYKCGPTIAKGIDHLPEIFRRGLAAGLDLIAKLIGLVN